MCAENSQGAETLGLRRFGFPCLASKNKGIPEKIRAGPHPKPTRLLLLPPPHSHTHTHSMAMRTHRCPAEQMVCIRVCVCVDYLALIHNSQPCLSLLLLLTIARQQSTATHIAEDCATASRCLGQPTRISFHPHSSNYIYDSDMKRVIYSRGSLTMSTQATRFPLHSRQWAKHRLQDGGWEQYD